MKRNSNATPRKIDQLRRIERKEQDGDVTIAQLRETAEAMGCEFRYAIVPGEDCESVVRQQAIKLATAQVMEANTQMQLEGSAPSQAFCEQQIKDMAGEHVKHPPVDLWSSDLLTD